MSRVFAFLGRQCVPEFLDLVVFVQKWPFRDAKLFSTKWVAETPIFIVVFGCELFWPSCQIQEFWTPTKKLTDNRKNSFFVFFVFLVLCFVLRV